MKIFKRHLKNEGNIMDEKNYGAVTNDLILPMNFVRCNIYSTSILAGVLFSSVYL